MFSHSKDTWGCAASKGILFQTSNLAKGIIFGNFSLDKDMLLAISMKKVKLLKLPYRNPELC